MTKKQTKKVIKPKPEKKAATQKIRKPQKERNSIRSKRNQKPIDEKNRRVIRKAKHQKGMISRKPKTGIKKLPSDSVKKPKAEEKKREYIRTGISGFDQLFEKGVPSGSNILVSGGAGSGKTIMCLQIIQNASNQGKKCIYMSFEEREERLREHMRDFGWSPEPLEKSGKLVIKRFSSFDISKSLDAIMAKDRGELLIDIDPLILPKEFNPDIVIVDSLSAISSYFVGKEENYRSYIEQLFRFFEKMGSTSFVITETEQVPSSFSRSGVEEFLADGVIVLYNFRKGQVRENAIEVLKMRGAGHKKKIVALQILPGKGIEVYPEQEVFSEF